MKTRTYFLQSKSVPLENFKKKKDSCGEFYKEGH